MVEKKWIKFSRPPFPDTNETPKKPELGTMMFAHPKVSLKLISREKEIPWLDLTWEGQAVPVTDFHGDTRFQFDTHGFTSRKIAGFPDLSDEDVVQNEYLPAVRQMLQEELDDVGHVFILGWRVSITARSE